MEDDLGMMKGKNGLFRAAGGGMLAYRLMEREQTR